MQACDTINNSVTVGNKVLWRRLEAHVDELGGGVAVRAEGVGVRSEGGEMVCDYTGEGENQLCTANTSSCHGLQLHI